MARLTIVSVTEKLKQFGGNISATARAHGVARQSVQDFIERYPELVQVLKDARETLVDNAESALSVAVAAQEQWAVKYVLSTLGKDRGYTERHELTGRDGGPLQYADMSEDELDQRIKEAEARLSGAADGEERPSRSA